MTLRNIFINDFGRLRSGWRLLFYVFAVMAAWYLIGAALWIAYVIVLAVASLPRSNFIFDVIYRFSVLGSSLTAGYLCARWLEGLPWRSLGLTLHVGWLKDLIIGFAVGFASLALAVGIAALGGGMSFSFNDALVTSIGRSMIGSAGYLFVAALAEEAMFRGYGLQTLTRARLAVLGVLLTSVPFGVAHLWNPNVSVPGFINTVLAGVWFGIAYLRTRSLWLPWGLHWSWNWALGWFFGLPVSGARLVSNPLFKATDTGPEWLTGASYGIEGGIAGTVALALSTLFLWRTSWVSATPELKKLTSDENPAIPEPVLTIRSVEGDATSSEFKL